MELFFGDNDRPGLASVAEHLFGLQELTLFENHVPDGLGRYGGGVELLLHAINERDADFRWFVIGSALDLNLAGGVGFLCLASIALGQELHARRYSWVQCIELYLHLRKELQHS